MFIKLLTLTILSCTVILANPAHQNVELRFKRGIFSDILDEAVDFAEYHGSQAYESAHDLINIGTLADRSDLYNRKEMREKNRKQDKLNKEIDDHLKNLKNITDTQKESLNKLQKNLLDILHDAKYQYEEKLKKLEIETKDV